MEVTNNELASGNREAHHEVDIGAADGFDANQGDSLRAARNNNLNVPESPSFYTPHPNTRYAYGISGANGSTNNNGAANAHVMPTAGQASQQVQMLRVYSFVENQLIESIKASLNHELFENATFLCEQLYALVQNEDVKHLLAQCYLGEGKAYKAYEILKFCESSQNRYKFALTCIKLNLFNEAEQALTGAKLKVNRHQDNIGYGSNNFLNLEENKNIPNGASGYYYLGLVCERQFKEKVAIDCYKKALSLQPSLWCAFQRLCKLQGGPESSEGVVDGAKFFNEKNADIQQMNRLIKEHMFNIHQYTNTAQSKALGIKRSGVVVNNFDQSPNLLANGAVNSNIPNELGETRQFDVDNKRRQMNQQLQPNQTPSPAKQSRDMKENVQSSMGAGSSLISARPNQEAQINTTVNMSVGSGNAPGSVSSKMLHAPSKINQQNSSSPQNKFGDSLRLDEDQLIRMNNQGTNLGITPPEGQDCGFNNQTIFKMSDASQKQNGFMFNPAAQQVIDQELGEGLMQNDLTGGVGSGLAPHLMNQAHQNTMIKQSSRMRQVPNCYESFFNQPNIIGDPVVKPFCINTPVQNQHNHLNQNFVANSTPQQNQYMVLSASKQMGLHLLQQSTGGKQAPLNREHYDFSASSMAVGSDDLIALLKSIAEAYQLQADYKCKEALNAYKRLPPQHFDTAWVTAQMARCHFELGQYEEAARLYEIMLKQQPYRLEGLEYYSTCLWQLKKQTDLCYIANYALQRSLHSPETWCILGNCYSLQKEHEQALKYFDRAIQLNSFFSYAHTLRGHEYVEIEDFEQANKCYDDALKTDKRHYLAWWGLGNVHHKQEKFEHAKQFFEDAIAINSHSAVLYTYVAMTLHNLNMKEEALATYAKAEEIDPKNVLNKFQKIQLLQTMDRDKEALKLLHELKAQLPREPPIYINIGKIYQKMGMKKEAQDAFNKAFDLDPKDLNSVGNMLKQLDQQPADMSDDQNEIEF